MAHQLHTHQDEHPERNRHQHLADATAIRKPQETQPSRERHQRDRKWEQEQRNDLLDDEHADPVEVLGSWGSL